MNNTCRCNNGKPTYAATPRYECLNLLKEKTYSRSRYVECIHNPTHRLIFTGLWVGMNVLKKNQGQYQKHKCPFCDAIENVSHFLFKCTKYENGRMENGTFASKTLKQMLREGF